MPLPLEGVKVIDVSQVAAMPIAGRILADYGADVIHVENPTTGDVFRHDGDEIWENFNRNKKGITLNLKQTTGQEILHRLLKNADILLCNLRPFEQERYRLTYDELKLLNPRLICTYLTGYGKEGPEKDMPGFDHTGFWARSGVSHRVRSLAPVLQKPGTITPAFFNAFGDTATGMILVSGVMMALFNRERTGEGDEVTTSLFQAGIYQQTYDIGRSLVTGADCETVDRNEVRSNPFFNQYLTKDQRLLLLSGTNAERYAPKYFTAIGRTDLVDDPRFGTTELILDNHAEIKQILRDAFGSKTLAEWRPVLDEAIAPYSPVQTYLEVLNDPQAEANHFFVSYDRGERGEFKGVASPISLRNYPSEVRRPAPGFSEHTDEVLQESGYSMEEIVEFKAQGVVF